MAGGEKLKVAIVEDHHEIRNGFAFMISRNGDFSCTEYSKAEDALAGFKLNVPDVVLMDINLPGMNGIECTKSIKQKYPSVLVIMCTVYEDDEKIFNALKAGASGYILKRAAIDTLIDAIRDVVNGGSPMSTTIARRVVLSFSGNSSGSGSELLSTRELEILNLLSEGYRIREAAEKLFVSVNTIRTHIRHIYEKLHVTSRVEAINRINGKKTL
jgi:DNA-binding NarL/FixJ family response regulator